MGLKLKKIIGVKSSSEGQKKELPHFREEKLSHKISINVSIIIQCTIPLHWYGSALLVLLLRLAQFCLLVCLFSCSCVPSDDLGKLIFPTYSPQVVFVRFGSKKGVASFLASWPTWSHFFIISCASEPFLNNNYRFLFDYFASEDCF